MIKNTPYIFSGLIILSRILGACSTTTGTEISAVNGTPLLAQASPVQASGQEGRSLPTPRPTEGPPGVMVPLLDWYTPWSVFLKTMPDDFYTISVDSLVSELGSGNPPYLLDVRERSELVEYGYIKGAVNIPYYDVFRNLDKLPGNDQSIVVYSGVGHRGTIILSALRLLGYTNVRLLDGGMSTWLKAKQPAETVSPATPAPASAPTANQAMITDLESFIDTGTYGITPEDLNTKLLGDTKPIILDVRENSEASTAGAFKGSMLIPIRSLFDNLEQLPADKTYPIVVVDSTGHRGTMAMMALRMIGYTNVRSLFGGYNAWVEAGLPIMN